MHVKYPPRLKTPASRLALFLDVDGTLAPITSRPEQSYVPANTRRTLLALQRRGVAIATLSGRPISQVRRLLKPLCVPASGAHGAQIRFSGRGMVCRQENVPVTIADILVAGVQRLPGVWLERKPGAFAIHWRQAPKSADEVDRITQQALNAAPGWQLLRGHCVHELRARGQNKGKALSRLMRSPEFAGRWPLAIGDDRTDEDAFRAALRLGGAAIKVGPTEPTTAPWCVKDVSVLAAWLKLQLRELR